MKKILFVTPTLRSGGAEKNIVNIINVLDKNEYDIFLVICGGQKDYLHLLPSNTKIHYLNKSSVFKAYPAIFKTLKFEKPDIVFTSAGHMSLPVVFFKVFFKKKYVTVSRVPSLPSNKLGKTLKAKLLSFFSKKMYRLSNYVVAQTDQMKKEIIETFRVYPNKVVVIRNFVNSTQIKKLASQENNCFEKRNFNLVAMGTLYSVKGFDTLIQAMKEVIKKTPNAVLYIIGQEGIEKGYKLKLIAQVNNLGLQEHVKFLGFQPNPYPYLKQADLFVLSSRKEGFPNVVLEALSIGTPALVTDCVDFSGIIEEGQNGLVIKKDNSKELANGIIKMKKISGKPLEIKNFNYNQWFQKITK